jgi:hypothetical protein
MLTRLFAAALAMLMISGSATAESPSELVGTWTLVSSVMEKDGKKTEQFGPGAHGMMSLDATGRFMLTIIGTDLPKFASNNRAAGSPEEIRAVVSKSIAMLGTYSSNLKEKTLTFRVETSTFPNWDATQQKRAIVNLTGDELKYLTAQASGGGTAIVTWRRAK